MPGPTGQTPILKLPFPTPSDSVDVPRDVQALAVKLDGENWRVVGAAGQPALQNGWVAYSGPFVLPPPAFYKQDGRVYLRGAVMNGTVGATVFVLPAGYRPVGGDVTMPVSVGGGSIGQASITALGEVSVEAASGASAGDVQAFSIFDALTFRAEA